MLTRCMVTVLGQIKQDLKRLLPWVGSNEVMISMEKELPALQDEVMVIIIVYNAYLSDSENLVSFVV